MSEYPLPRPLLPRRAVLALAAASVLGAAVFLPSALRRQSTETDILSVQEAYKMAKDGDILLVDIRRPDEWAATGIGDGAIPLDMRRDDFLDALSGLVADTPERPIALICARGGRSARLQQRLTDAGLSNVVDVSEGMLGSGAGPGWLRAKLPVTPYNAEG